MIRRLIGLAALAFLASEPGVAKAQQLTDLHFDLVGVRLAVDPPTLTVPRGIPTFVNAELELPVGASAEQAAAIEALADGAAVLAELRGPNIATTTITALPGEPLHLPPFQLAGDYFLDNIRLVKDGETLLFGTPPSVPIAVIGEIVISSVTTRELTLDEIRERGIVIDASSFRVVEFQAAFVIDGRPVRIDFPVIVPEQVGATTPAFRGFGTVEAADGFGPEQALRLVAELPPELDRPGLNLYLVGAEFVEGSPSEGGRGLEIPPIPALLLIAGNIGYLNQIFSAVVMVENGAPQGANLRLTEIRGGIALPRGLDRVAGTPDAPGDDPLRLSRTQSGVTSGVDIVRAGPDGAFGTGDDVDTLGPGENGQGEFLIEGLREGTHVFDVDLEATLLGLPSGPVALESRVLGTVRVRNASFALTLGQPDTVLSGEPYDLFATVTNTSDRVANLVSITLDEHAVSGAVLESDQTVTFDTLAPGEAQIATFRLRAQRTGRVTFTQITSGPGVTTDFVLRTGVDERDVPLSPDSLVLPRQTTRVPDSIVVASQRVLGQAYAVATAPRMPPNVRYVPRRVVFQRARELAELSIFDSFQLPIDRGLHELALDWLGNSLADPGFEQLLRTTESGDHWADALGALLAAGSPGAGAVDVQRALEDTVVYRAPHLSAAVGDGAGPGPARLRISSELGMSFERGPPDAPRALRTLPFSHSFPLAESGALRSELAIVGRALSDVYTIEGIGTGDGATDLGVVIPSGDGVLTQAIWRGIPTSPSSRFSLRVDLRTPGALSLRIDLDGDGRFETTRPPDQLVAILDRAPTVLGARSLTDLSEAFIYNSAHAHVGLLVDVLFSKEVTAASAETPENWGIESNEIADVALQPTGRVATLFLDQPIGALVPRALSVAGISDTRGALSTAQTLPIAGLLADGARLVGQVSRADGRPVRNAIVQLYMFIDLPFAGGVFISEISADENGYYAFDFVRRTLSPFFWVRALDPETLDAAEAQSRVRFEGGTEIVNPVFFGRGRVVGRVLDPDGVSSAGISAVNFFPDWYRTGETGRGVYTGEDGTFAFDDVPVGRFSLRAETVEFRDVGGRLVAFATGRFATVSGAILVEGDTVEIDIVTTTRPDVPPGGVRGRVFLSSGEPAASFPVFLGSIRQELLPGSPLEIHATHETRSDVDGSFEFLDIDPGGRHVISFDPSTRALAHAGVSVRSLEIVGVNLVFGATSPVSGVVRNARGELVAGALVSGGYELVSADANGFFRIPEVPIGERSIAAGDPVTKRTGSERVSVLPGQESFVSVTLGAAADIFGHVTNALGDPVAGATVKIPVPGAGYFKAVSNADGDFLFPNMGIGDYTVSASGSGAIDERAGELADRLTAQMGDALRSGSMAAIRAALELASQAYVSSQHPPDDSEPTTTPGAFGFTKATVAVDEVGVRADIQYIPSGPIGGRTIDANGLGTRASMQISGLKLDEIGSPRFGTLAFLDSDSVTGRFDLSGVTFGDYLVSAARPFSSRIVSRSGALSLQNPDDLDLVLQFPAPDLDNVLTGVVFEPDGITRVGENVEVQINVGNPPLTPRTRADGTFDSQLPLPDGFYTLTAVRAGTGDSGQVGASLGGRAIAPIPIRLLGRGPGSVVVQRPDGTLVPGATVTITGHGFPGDQASGVTDAFGRFRAAGLREGYYGVLATEGDQLTARGGFQIRQEDALAGSEVSTTVTLRGTGTITGTFLAADGVTPVADGQVGLRVEGISSVQFMGPMAALTTSDADGRFAFDRVPVGSFTITGLNPRSLRIGQTAGRLVAQNDAVDVVVLERGLGSVRGRVLSGDGRQPIPGASVSIQPATFPVRTDDIPRITASADGSFGFDAVPDGPFTVEASDPVTGFFGKASGVVAGEGAVADVEVRIQSFGAVSGRVLAADGVTPVTSADVVLAINRSNITRATAVDSSGAFRFEQIPAGTHRVSARERDPLRDESVGGIEVTLSEHGEEVVADVVVSGVGTVNVSVVDAGGAPIAVANVSIAEQSNATGPNAEPAVFPNVRVGAFTAQADAPHLRVAGSVTGSVPADNDVVDVTVALGPAGQVQGRLVLPPIPGQPTTPVANARVLIRFAAQAGVGLLEVRSDALGLFGFEHISVGDFRLEISEEVTRGERVLEGVVSLNEEIVDTGDVELDLQAPFVLATTPPNGAGAVPVDQVISLLFSEPIDPGTLRFDDSGTPYANAGNVWLTNEHGEKLHGTAEFSADGMQLDITPQLLFESETMYEVVLSAGTSGLRDAAAERPLASAFSFSFTSRDSIPPQLLSAVPADGETEVQPIAVVRLAFDEAMDDGYALTLTRDGAPVAGSVATLLGGTVAVFTPEGPLALDETYTWSLGAATDLAGNPLVGGDRSASFATLDTVGPAVDAFTPLGPASPPAGTPLSLEAIVLATDVERLVWSVNDVPVETDTTRPFALNVVRPLQESSVRIAAVAFDGTGNQGAVREQVFAFVPNDPPVLSLSAPLGTSTFAGDRVPLLLTASDDVGLSVISLSAVGAVSRSIPVLVPPGSTSFGTTAELVIPDAAPSQGEFFVQAIAVDTLGQPSATATLELTLEDHRPPSLALTAPVPGAQVLPGQIVDATLLASDEVGVRSVTLACEPALAGCETRLFGDPAPTATTQGFALSIPASAAAPFSVEIVASALDTAGNPRTLGTRTIALVDLIPPEVLALTSLSGSTRVAQGQSARVRAEVADNVAVASLEWSVDGVPGSGQMLPVAPPAANALVDLGFVVPTGAADGAILTVRARARDTQGSLGPERALALTVGDTDPPALALDVSPLEASPGEAFSARADATDDVALARIELAVSGAFAATESFDVTPQRIAASATFPIVVPAGTLPGPALVEVSALDVSGKRSPLATQTVAVIDETPPVVSITSPAPGTSVDPRVPLQVTVHASDAVGVSELSVPGETRALPLAPTSVDETFSVSLGTPPATAQPFALQASARDVAGNLGNAPAVEITLQDVVGPVVANTAPAAGATGVPIDAVVSVFLSEAVDPASISTESVRLLAGGAPLAATATLTGGDQVLRIAPSADLPVFSAITVELSSAIVDVAGNALDAFTLAFTTESADVVGPRIVSSTPSDGASEVNPAVTILVNFDEALAPTSVDAASFSLQGCGVPVAGSTALTSANRTIRFIAADGLPLACPIVVTLTGAITDPFGNPLQPPFQIAFTTASFALTAPLDGATVPEDTEIVLQARASASLGVANVVFSVNGVAEPPAAAPGFTRAFTTPFAQAVPTLEIVASGRNASGVEVASDSATVSVGSALGLEPEIAGLPVGGTRRLRLFLSTPQSADLEISLAPLVPGVVTLPALAVIPAGETEVSVDALGLGVGNTTVVASSALGDAAAVLSVSVPVPGTELPSYAAPTGVFTLVPPSIGTAVLVPGADRAVLLRVLDAPAAATIDVSVLVADPSIVSVVGAPQIAAGSQSLLLTLRPGALGRTDVVLRAGPDIARTLGVVVGTPGPDDLPPTVTRAVGIAVLPAPSVGQAILTGTGDATVTVRVLDADAPSPIDVTVLVADPTIVSVIGPTQIAAGSRSLTLVLRPGVNGRTDLTLLAGPGVARTLSVVVGPPSASDVPPTLAKPVGIRVLPPPSLGRVILLGAADQALALPILDVATPLELELEATVSDPAVATVIGPVVIPAGGRSATLVLHSVAAGTATVTLRAPGIARVLTVIVGTPPAAELPPTVSGAAGVAVLPAPSAGQAILGDSDPHTLVVRLLAAPAAAPTGVSVFVSDPSVVSVVGSVQIAAGSQTAVVTLQSGATGETQITLTPTGATPRGLTVIVGAPGASDVEPAASKAVGVEVSD